MKLINVPEWIEADKIAECLKIVDKELVDVEVTVRDNVSGG